MFLGTQHQRQLLDHSVKQDTRLNGPLTDWSTFYVLLKGLLWTMDLIIDNPEVDEHLSVLM